MKLNVAVQMDPIDRINIRGDSTFALLLEAQKRGHGLSYYTPDKLSLRGDELFAPVQILSVRDEPGDHFTLGEARREQLSAFDVILLRQDPPFDLAYITSTHFLERLHPKTLVVNNPASVRNAPEKIFVMDFPDLMPPTLISRDLDEINSFRDEHGAVVMKPLHGHGGAAVFRIMPQDMNFGSLFDMFSVTFREPWVIQRFLPEVKHGDKRIIPRPGAARARIIVRRHRRHRRPPHRDQRDVTDGYSSHRTAGRAGCRGEDLGCDRGEAGVSSAPDYYSIFKRVGRIEPKA